MCVTQLCLFDVYVYIYISYVFFQQNTPVLNVCFDIVASNINILVGRQPCTRSPPLRISPDANVHVCQ